jgi:hypothetical protein
MAQMILQGIPAGTTHNVTDKEDSHCNDNSCHKKRKTGCPDPLRPTWLGKLNRNTNPLRVKSH